jgi:hypothetical protein
MAYWEHDEFDLNTAAFVAENAGHPVAREYIEQQGGSVSMFPGYNLEHLVLESVSIRAQTSRFHDEIRVFRGCVRWGSPPEEMRITVTDKSVKSEDECTYPRNPNPSPPLTYAEYICGKAGRGDSFEFMDFEIESLRDPAPRIARNNW